MRPQPMCEPQKTTSTEHFWRYNLFARPTRGGKTGSFGGRFYLVSPHAIAVVREGFCPPFVHGSACSSHQPVECSCYFVNATPLGKIDCLELLIEKDVCRFIEYR